MMIFFEIKNKNDYKEIFIDPPISTVQGKQSIDGSKRSTLFIHSRWEDVKSHIPWSTKLDGYGWPRLVHKFSNSVTN